MLGVPSHYLLYGTALLVLAFMAYKYAKKPALIGSQGSVFFLLVVAFLLTFAIREQNQLSLVDEVSEFSAEQEAFREVFFSLMSISLERNLTDEDVTQLDAVVPKDNHKAQDELREAHWMAERNISDQIPHTLENLYTLIVRNAEITCLSHAVEHLEIFRAYNDTEMVEHATEELEEIRENYNAYIQFYQAKNVSKTYNDVDLESINRKTNELKQLLDQGLYSDAIANDLKQLPC